jgi:hypothetical protein
VPRCSATRSSCPRSAPSLELGAAPALERGHRRQERDVDDIADLARALAEPKPDRGAVDAGLLEVELDVLAVADAAHARDP